MQATHLCKPTCANHPRRDEETPRPSAHAAKPTVSHHPVALQVVGVLKGYDALLNLVLDETKEFLKDPDDPYKLLDETRPMGLTVCRGTSVS